jgi:hypothetical protein
VVAGRLQVAELKLEATEDAERDDGEEPSNAGLAEGETSFGRGARLVDEAQVCLLDSPARKNTPEALACLLDPVVPKDRLADGPWTGGRPTAAQGCGASECSATVFRGAWRASASKSAS